VKVRRIWKADWRTCSKYFYFRCRTAG